MVVSCCTVFFSFFFFDHCTRTQERRKGGSGDCCVAAGCRCVVSVQRCFSRMWGGVKARVQHGDIFRAWSASQGLETLRHRLHREPRPWYVAWSLHKHRHLMGDHHCARLLAWCATVMNLERRRPAKRQAYMCAQQVFQVMVHSHKVGAETYREFFRLCATARDLTTAFHWQQYLVETGQSFPLSHYTWLLHIAALSPNDEQAEDMAEAVWEVYVARYCCPVRNDVTGDTATSHFQPSNEEESRQLEGLFRAFKALRPKIEHGTKSELLQFIDSLPDVTNSCAVNSAWPTTSRHHTFRELEAGASWKPPSLFHPRLRDSLLHADFVGDLEKAAFSSNVQRVVEMVNEYLKRILAEKNKTSAEEYRAAGRRDIWHCFADPSAMAFRKPLVEEGGVTAELYHYLIVALSTTQPSMALRTLRRMEEAGLRVLDLTRAVMIVRTEGSAAEQQALFQDQIREMELRRKIDEDYDITREVELFWKFKYAEFFHYRNSLTSMEFYRLLIEGLGPARVQQLLLDAKLHDVCALEDVVVLNKAFREAAAMHYRSLLGETEVNNALDTIARQMPKLDISLMGSLPHFSDYALPESDFVATDVLTLREKLGGYSKIFILDSSFVETSEQFLALGRSSIAKEPGSFLVLVPYCCLRQLASTIEQEEDIVSFDAALQANNNAEPFIASQRLRGLFALLNEGGNMNTRTRVLHFSECLLAHTVDTAGLDPGHSDNDHLLLVLAMIRAIAPETSRVVLCTDDAHLVKLLYSEKHASLFAGEVLVMSSAPSQEIVNTEENLINDNPDLCVPIDFEPKLHSSITDTERNHVSSGKLMAPSALQASAVDTDAATPTWLDMLDEEEEKTQRPSDAACSATPDQNNVLKEGVMAGNEEESDDDGAKEHERLMNMYDSEHAVTPVGVRMAEASSLGSVFEQFDVLGPDAELDRAASSTAAPRTSDQPRDKFARRSLLDMEAKRNRGASNKQRFRLAKRLSNISGRRVPFNFRYRVVEVDITDPRNKSFRDAYKEGVAKKRESFKRKFHDSYLVGNVLP